MVMAQKYGYPQAEYTQSNWSLGWTAAQTIVQALKNAGGDYSSAGIKKGLEMIRNMQTGLTPDITYSTFIALQNHGTPVWFRDLKIRILE